MKTRVIDLSCGCRHLREIAEESGVNWMMTVSREETVNIGSLKIDVWYDEETSSPFAWKAWIKGVGQASGYSREAAIEEAFAKAKGIL